MTRHHHRTSVDVRNNPDILSIKYQRKMGPQSKHLYIGAKSLLYLVIRRMLKCAQEPSIQ